MPTVKQRIAARLHEALDHQERADISAPAARRGLAVGGPDAPAIVLTVEDAARIAAATLDPDPSPGNRQDGHTIDEQGIIRVTAAETAVFERAAIAFTGIADGAAAYAWAPGTVAFVAVQGDQIQGWCWGHHLARPDGASMLYLHHLEVAEASRRQGVGRRLLTAFRATGVHLGARAMFLTTGEANTAARRLYESMGAGLATQGPTVNYWFRLHQPDET
jgi:ribosomal protein S18 acetylase RimI-like enzyme